MNENAISYLRFSTTPQSLGQSAERQTEAAEDYCAAHGLTLIDRLSDLGLSAFRGTHRKTGALAGFLEAVSAGRIPRGTYLIVEALDRLSRENVTRAIHQFTDLVLAGIKVVTLKDQMVHSEETVNAEPYRLFHSLALMIAANEESALKSRRVKAAWQSKRNKASNGHILTQIRPAWVDLVEGKLVANPQGAATVRRIFQDVANGMGCFSVASRLQAEWKTTGAHPPLSGDKKTNGWNKSRILEIVKSNAPLGVLHTHTRKEDGKTRAPGEMIEGYYPVIVDQLLANRARAAIAARSFGKSGGRKGTVYSNLLSGIAKCGECGGSMTIFNGHHGYHYLRCGNGIRGNDCDNNSPIRYNTLEMALLRDIDWVIFMQSKMPKADPTVEIIERIAKKVDKAQRLRATIRAMKERFSLNPLPAILEQMQESAEGDVVITNEIEELRRELATVERKSVPVDIAGEKAKLEAAMESNDDGLKFEVRSRIAHILRDLIESVTCLSDKTTEVKFASQYMPKIRTTAEMEERLLQLQVLMYISLKYDADLTPHIMFNVENCDGRYEREVTGAAPDVLLDAMLNVPPEDGDAAFSSMTLRRSQDGSLRLE